MLNFLMGLFKTDFMPHGMCYLWKPQVLWLHATSDGLIAAAYFAIPALLIQLVRKRKGIEFHWIFWMFAAFILLCGTTHILGIVTIWCPVYRFDGFVKLLTGVVSIATAITLIRLIPEILAIPLPEELAAANRELAKQVEVNKQTEQSLRELNSELERRVVQRTAELERSNRELSQFAYVASHDLQEPLRMISNYTGLLKKRYSSHLDEEAQVFMGFAIDGAYRMRELITDLLTYAQIEHLSSSFREVKAGAAVERALSSLRLSIEEQQAKIVVDPLPSVTGDEIQVAQIFQNLISNSLKYRSRESPKIHIWAGAAVEAGKQKFFVSDNGIGFDSRYKNRLFAIFQRLETGQPGTGIGLAICKKIVEQHGGRIDIDSTIGVGTTVSFTLPAT